MDRLPEDVVVMILPYIGGADFINIRQTCKRLKDIADELEISSKPALWRWYVLCDFPHSCVECIAPWLYVEDKNDPFIWKMLYVRLKKISSLAGVRLNFIHLQFDSKDVHLTKDVKFFDRYLFLIEKPSLLTLIGLDDMSWKWPVTLCDKSQLGDGHEVSTRKLYSQHVAEISERSGSFKLFNKGKSSPCELIVQRVLKDVKKLNLCWKFSSMPQLCYDRNADVCISTWTSNTIYYKHHCGLEESMIYISNYDNKENDFPRKIRFRTTVNGFKSLAFNDKWIVAVCENRTACIIPNSTSEKPVNVFTHTLRVEATKIKLLGDLAIILYGDGVLETAQIVTDQTNQIKFANWQGLAEQTRACYPGHLNAIKDFVIQGQLFSAILANGDIFLSHFESLDHDSLERNLHSPYKISLSSDTACLTRMTVDVDDGLKLAVVETLGYLPIAKLHVLYVDRHR